MLIEDFVEALAVTQEVHPIAHHIAASDIEGKLFLYLWDNVFERDKSPLAEWLRIPPESLRTFGQFSARRDDFIRSFTVSEDLHAAA
jgi:5-methylcytosine-specific restriction enzyme B